MSEKYDVFLSYHAKEREWVSQLAEALSEEGVMIWYDEREIRAGDKVADLLEEGLRESAYVVFVITPETVHSNWMAAELGAALALQKPIIGVVSEDTPLEDLPGPIRLRKYLRKGDPKAVAKEIAHRIAVERKGEGRANAKREVSPA